MIKKFIVPITVAVIAILFIVLHIAKVPTVFNTGYLYRECGINENKCELVSKTDSHGGFHGDGTYSAVYDCTACKDYILKIVQKWNRFPLSENLELILYGGEKDGLTYGYELAKGIGFPKISDGYWFFLDRHSERKNSNSDEELFVRYSFNFSVAIYDADSNMLYYIREDT